VNTVSIDHFSLQLVFGLSDSTSSVIFTVSIVLDPDYIIIIMLENRLPFRSPLLFPALMLLAWRLFLIKLVLVLLLLLFFFLFVLDVGFGLQGGAILPVVLVFDVPPSELPIGSAALRAFKRRPKRCCLSERNTVSSEGKVI
jgi:hypothetical protein